VKEDFQPRLVEALRRRLYPNTAVHLKQLAGAIGRAENTVARWWHGEHNITARDLHNIAEFLAKRGDRQFLLDVFGDLLPAPKGSADIEESVLAHLRSAVVKLSNPGNEPDRCFWFTADGVMAFAPLGHAEFVGRTFGLPLIQPGDLSVYAVHLAGWIAATLRADGRAIIRHDSRNVSPSAAERTCEWLAEQGSRISICHRAVHVDGRWAEALHDNIESVIAAVSKVAFIVQNPRRPWVVKRLSLDSISDHRLEQLFRIHKEVPDKIIHAAAEIGAFTTSNVLGVDGEDVISHHAATAFELNQRLIEGQNVLARPDTNYAMMIRERILNTKRHGPTYYELSGTINNMYTRYLNLALPEAGPGGRVLTSSVVLELEHLAAA